MVGRTNGPEIVRVTQNGQVTIPGPLRETVGIEAPDEVFVYEEGGRIDGDPLPSLQDL